MNLKKNNEPIPGHIVKCVAWKKVSNGGISLLHRCCGDPTTDHWQTLSHDLRVDKQGNVIHGIDDQSIDEKISNEQILVAKQHQSMNAAIQYIKKSYIEGEIQDAPAETKMTCLN